MRTNRDRIRTLLRGIIGIFIIVAVGVPFWLFWPVTVPREPIADLLNSVQLSVQ